MLFPSGKDMLKINNVTIGLRSTSRLHRLTNVYPAHVECIWEVDAYEGSSTIFGAGLKVSCIIFGIYRAYSNLLFPEICVVVAPLRGDSHYTGKGFLQHSGDCCLTVTSYSEETE
jgi:hypothetical protein